MRSITPFRLCLVIALGAALVACGDRAGQQLPTASSPQQAIGGSMPTPSGGSPVVMHGASEGVAPEGFRMKVHVKPLPDFGDGIVRGVSPLTVDFDLCDSTADAGKTLYFLYDWEFDNIANLVGTDTACEQEHTYRSKRTTDGIGDQTFRTNICIANDDPRAHVHGTFYACREYTIVLPVGQVKPAPTTGTKVLVGSYQVDSGPNWTTDPPTYSCTEACAINFGGAAADYACSTVSTSIDGNAHASTIYVSGCQTVADNYKLNNHYYCSTNACATSALVWDNCQGVAGTNYCFR